MSDPFSVITWQTVLASMIAGLAFGAFLWVTARRLQPALLITLLTAGLSFCACIGLSRAIGTGNVWQVWFGIGVLWTWFVGVAAASVYAWRRLRRDRGGR